MADLFCSDEFTPTDKLKAVEREISFRRYVYPRRVGQGKMTQADADKGIAVMEAVAADYRKLVHGQ
jgi:hypothetical protein